MRLLCIGLVSFSFLALAQPQPKATIAQPGLAQAQQVSLHVPESGILVRVAPGADPFKTVSADSRPFIESDAAATWASVAASFFVGIVTIILFFRQTKIQAVQASLQEQQNDLQVGFAAAEAKRHELQMFDAFMGRILTAEVELQKQYILPFREALFKAYEEQTLPDNKEFKAWERQFYSQRETAGLLFFNSIEYWCHAVNENLISDPRLITYFDPAIVRWHDDLMQQHFPDLYRDKTHSKEFKLRRQTIGDRADRGGGSRKPH
jgi:hypothetical protein